MKPKDLNKRLRELRVKAGYIQQVHDFTEPMTIEYSEPYTRNSKNRLVRNIKICRLCRCAMLQRDNEDWYEAPEPFISPQVKEKIINQMESEHNA